jgi:hypothetical protein
LAKRNPEFQPQSAAETVRRIENGTDPWVAFGQFVDDWRRTEIRERSGLIGEPLPAVTDELARWAALVAAAVDWLCAQDSLGVPSWVNAPGYRLTEPWFLYPGWRLRLWQLVETPAPFKARNIFGGDRILDRV